MAFFTEHMQVLSNDISKSRLSREATIASLKKDTVQILADSRTLMQNISAKTRETLKAAHQARFEYVNAFRERIRGEFHDRSVTLHKMLAENCSGRSKEVSETLQALAADFQGAAKVWRGMAHGNSAVKTAPAQKAAPAHAAAPVSAPAAGHTTTSSHSPAPSHSPAASHAAASGHTAASSHSHTPAPAHTAATSHETHGGTDHHKKSRGN